MSDLCEIEARNGIKITRLWRNGLECPGRKLCSPKCPEEVDVREWQMSPFGNARFDLDEIQRAEKKGYKGREELERLKALYGMSDGNESCKPKRPPCAVCEEREAQEKKRKQICDENIEYQPYGPIMIPSMSFSKPETTVRNVPYTYLGPSIYSKGTRSPPPSPHTIVPCPERFAENYRDLSRVYQPYGPAQDLRFNPCMYVPMGPGVDSYR